MTRDDCANNAAAYVLGALDAAEAADYERHLTACATCREEVAGLQPVADALPMSAPQYRVPADLRRRVVRTVRSESRGARARPTARLVFAGALAILLLLAAAGVVSRRGAAGPEVIAASVRGSTGTAALRISHGHAELIVRRMPRPAPGRIYEIWLERPGAGPAPTRALFGVAAGGTADVAVPGDLHGVSKVLVTQEPAGGSPVPTPPR